MSVILSIQNLGKTYASGFEALKDVSLDIRRGEIFALLGPNGAGKTTLIGIVCGIVNGSAGRVCVDGHDIARDFRAARAKIGSRVACSASRTTTRTLNGCCASCRCGTSAATKS